MIDVSKDEFTKSFNKHYSIYKINPIVEDTKRLILFYAVECGLKSRLMYKRNVHMYTKLNEEDKCGHDIKKLLKKLGIEARYNLLSLKTNHNDHISSKEYQELWRYGVCICKSDKNEQRDKLIEDELNKIALWLENNPNRK